MTGFLLSILALIGLLGTLPVSAQQSCDHPVARVESIVNRVRLTRAATQTVVPATLRMNVCPGDTVSAEDNSRAVVAFLNSGDAMVVEANSQFVLVDAPATRRSVIDVIRGAVLFITRQPRPLEVRTPFVNASVEGTEFVVRVTDDRTDIVVLEGTVHAANALGGLDIRSNQAGVAIEGQAPQLRVLVRPRDAVQWALYYEPLHPFDSFAQLDLLPETDRGPDFHSRRAALLLEAGRLDDARTDIDRALVLDPNDSEAYALRTVIDVARNDPESALKNGQRAVDRNPKSATARLALSYALQSRFELEAARDQLLEAVANEPSHALAWARLAELWLCLGELDEALASARRAAALSPDLSRTNTVLGFAALVQLELDDARRAFELAIERDSASPLARLGLGLTGIRGGHLREGRRDLEIAVSLDPNDAILRTYLGKAYFDEKRRMLDGDQLDMARTLDPRDPEVPYLNAIRLQTLNRPIEALQDLERSIELNENRAVYRSRLGLDQDMAARSVSLASIYSDLNFGQSALSEAWRSLDADPGNFATHRFLAETYSVLPRHETARISEALQSQLRQPANINPVPPELSEPDQLILDGTDPRDPGFNEFTQLYNRNRLALRLNATAGEHATWSNDILLSGVGGRLSFGLGRFHYETDGFRDNDDQMRTLYTAFGQVTVSPHTSLQVEHRDRRAELGDLPLRFDPDNFLPSLREHDDHRSTRLGLRQILSPRADVIAHVTRGVSEFAVTPVPDATLAVDETGYQLEAQHLFRGSAIAVTTGASYSSATREETDSLGDSPSLTEERGRSVGLYCYAPLKLGSSVTLTLGASGDLFRGIVDRNQVNPKVGLFWRPTPRTTFRAAAARTLQKNLIEDQTVEPTAVAGFNQFFDDAEGASARLFGVGFDQKAGSGVYAGGEVTERILEIPGLVPTPSGQTVMRGDSRETLARGYVNWTVGRSVAVSASYLLEDLDRDADFIGPEEAAAVTTHRVSTSASVFAPSGFRVRAEATYISQRGDFGAPSGGTAQAHSGFWYCDLSIGYRLPARYGLVTLDVRNLLNERFQFQDTDPFNPKVYPSRYVVLRLLTNF